MNRWPPLAAALLTASPAFADLPADCAGLGAALVDHSCFHTTYGPFETIPAINGAAGPATPNLDAVHTDYRVGLAGPEAR